MWAWFWKRKLFYRMSRRKPLYPSRSKTNIMSSKRTHGILLAVILAVSQTGQESRYGRGRGVLALRNTHSRRLGKRSKARGKKQGGKDHWDDDWGWGSRSGKSRKKKSSSTSKSSKSSSKSSKSSGKPSNGNRWNDDGYGECNSNIPVSYWWEEMVLMLINFLIQLFLLPDNVSTHFISQIFSVCSWSRNIDQCDGNLCEAREISPCTMD